MTPYMLISPMKVRYKMGISLLKTIPKNLDPSYKTDLDIWNCLKGKITSLIAKEIQ